MDIFLAAAGLLASFFFAGSESAFTAYNKIRLDIWDKQKKRFISAAIFFQKEPEDFFSTILIGNNFANILYTTFATVWLIGYIDESIAWVLITIVVLFFGEIFPKTLFRSLADKIILQTLAIVRIFFWLFKPLIYSLNFLIDIILKIAGIKHKSVMNYFSRDELQMLLHSGVGRNEEQKYISNVLQLKDVKVREAMIPRTELMAAENSSDWDTLYDNMIQHNASFILLYSDSIDNITGVLFAYDLFRSERDIAKLNRPLRYVPENKSCAQLLREFQRDNISLAVVVDEYGGTAGLVTMDDLIEEVFGEVEPLGQVKALNQHTWLLDARIEIDLLEELLDISFEDIQLETVAGLILEKTGTIPAEGARIEFTNFRIEIVRATRKRILKVKLIKNK